jgi:hypothetical protein
MATREETDKIRALLQQQANQRVNPFMKGLSMLTGGIAGEFTGTNEDIRNRNYAKRALMEEDLKSLNEERLGSRMEAERQQRLQDEIKLIAARDKAASETRAKEAGEKRETLRPSLVGQLKARPEYQLGGSMAMPIPALEPIESLEEQVSYEKAIQEQKDEAKKLKSGYMQYNIGGRTVGGTPDQIAAMAEKDPVLRKFIQEGPPDEAPFTTSWSRDSLTGQPTVKLNFGFNPKTGKSFSYEEQKQITDQYFGGQSQSFPIPAPTGTSSTKATKPTSFPGYRVTIPGEEELK